MHFGNHATSPIARSASQHEPPFVLLVHLTKPVCTKERGLSSYTNTFYQRELPYKKWWARPPTKRTKVELHLRQRLSGGLNQCSYSSNTTWHAYMRDSCATVACQHDGMTTFARPGFCRALFDPYERLRMVLQLTRCWVGHMSQRHSQKALQLIHMRRK